ncbi:hypothetical protein AJ79_02808 [Helicocarpus griseus UAMH5409]|uniref:MOSC domain-containing protein n=1 Tax=Helicocarpus griseus UAMH5409 TaxID=1447875 RepID=A0A2B7Y1Q0_9EURO|nr:hypothetical protein AJ79_02808 [Helicocarpus griseus UAMH5409]
MQHGIILEDHIYISLYIYPIKSLRGTPISHARITRHGLSYDRHFMLLKVEPDKSLRNMHVSVFNEMSLFRTDVIFPSESVEGKILVRYQAPVGHPDRDVVRELEVPLEPTDLETLRGIDVDMNSSASKAYDMGKKYSDWFTECFGFEVILAYLGGNRRPVLGNISPNAVGKQPRASGSDSATGWLSSITKAVPYLGNGASSEDDERITFADVAAYLVISEASLQNVSSRLPENEPMDITKFRPNIVLSGPVEAFDEDFWGEVTVKDSIKFNLTSNCARCLSINIDYDTGTQGSGESGSVLKKLMKDRRVDQGMKYNPVFGRYGFIDKGSEGAIVTVGDEAVVSKRNEERTKFCRLNPRPFFVSLGENMVKTDSIIQIGRNCQADLVRGFPVIFG